MPYTAGVSLRERKRARTRQALVDAAVDLFERNGYERTTIAEIAAAAEIGTRTFFSYFSAKEEVLFPESDARVQASIDAIESRRPGETPVDVLLRGLHEATAGSDDMTGRTARLRTALFRTVPAVRGRGLQIQLDGQRRIARHLAAAYPGELDEIGAAALAGALTGAVTAALMVIFEDPGRPPELAALKAAVETALRPWGQNPKTVSHSAD